MQSIGIPLDIHDMENLQQEEGKGVPECVRSTDAYPRQHPPRGCSLGHRRRETFQRNHDDTRVVVLRPFWRPRACVLTFKASS